LAEVVMHSGGLEHLWELKLPGSHQVEDGVLAALLRAAQSCKKLSFLEMGTLGSLAMHALCDGIVQDSWPEWVMMQFCSWLSLEELYHDERAEEEIENEGGGPRFLALAKIMLSCSFYLDKCSNRVDFANARDYAEAQRRLKEEYMSHPDRYNIQIV